MTTATKTKKQPKAAQATGEQQEGEQGGEGQEQKAAPSAPKAKAKKDAPKKEHIILPDAPITVKKGVVVPNSSELGKRIAESRKALETPLEPGQAFFESPEGFIQVGEADAPHVWCRHANGGKGMWINPYRPGNADGLKKIKAAKKA